MSLKKRILVVCGSGIATSTVVAGKVREYLASHGVEAELKQCLTSEVTWEAEHADLIVATTQVPAAVKIPVISGVPLLTGVGANRVLEEVLAKLKP
jgi:galactitol PTS system EIIB component